VVLELDRLSKHYGRIDACQSVSLSVREGEIFGLLGPNGAGKTTLIRLITGSTQPTSGTIRVLDTDLLRQPGDSTPDPARLDTSGKSDPTRRATDLRVDCAHFGDANLARNRLSVPLRSARVVE
jgi:ABC-type cobalamin/Fe3+-siderophores transport system ATPase subunit